MQAKSFLFMSIVVVVAVAVVTSLIGVKLMEPTLMAPEQEGIVQVQGLTSPEYNVIIVDDVGIGIIDFRCSKRKFL